MEHKFKEKNKSIWSMTTHLPPRDPLPGNLTVEAAVIGAGMAGILTAYLLQKQGVDVVVLEADQVASGQTKNTTAKITSQHGIIYHDLIKKLGKQKAAAYALANEAAVRAYGEIVAEEKIECDFERLPSYLYTTQPSMTAKLEQEAKAASALGIPAHFTQIHGLPFETVGAVCFEGQAQFHPLAFIKHLSQKVTVYEGTRVLKVKKHMIFTDRGTVNAGHVIFASHYPFLNLPGMFFARQHQHHREEDGGGPVHHGALAQLEHAGEDQGAHAGPHAVEGVDHHAQMGEILKEGRDEHDDDDAGKDQPQGGHHSAGVALPAVAHEGGGVDRDDAGCALADGEVVGELLLRGPPPLLHQLPLEDGQHGVAAAKGTHADFGKGPEQIQIGMHGNHHSLVK